MIKILLVALPVGVWAAIDIRWVSSSAAGGADGSSYVNAWTLQEGAA